MWRSPTLRVEKASSGRLAQVTEVSLVLVQWQAGINRMRPAGCLGQNAPGVPSVDRAGQHERRAMAFCHSRRGGSSRLQRWRHKASLSAILLYHFAFFDASSKHRCPCPSKVAAMMGDKNAAAKTMSTETRKQREIRQ